MQNLGTLTGGTFSYAYAVSADGSVVVGDSDSTGGDVSYRWTASGGMVSLGIPSGGFSYMVSNGVSADGSVIVGGVVGPPDTAFLWSAPIGLVDLNVYLPAIGINLAGWTLTEAGGVSADGRTVVGTGIHNGVEEAWIATLPGTSAISFCFGDGTGTACPCANTGNVGHGCDNRQPTGTGGALLGGSGLASLSGDALTLNVVNSLDHVHVLFEGTQNTGFLRYGAGLRCVRGGTNGSGQSFLKRLEQGTPTGGGISFSGVSLASSSKGAPLVPGETYDYYVAYRDAEMNGAPGCPGFAFGFNSTNACAVTWSP
jgi:hypothetical protein